MISDGRGRYIFMRLFIFFFRCLTPLSLIYCFLLAAQLFPTYRLPFALEIYAGAESTFYLFVFLPRRKIAQRSALHPAPLPTRTKRRDLFQKGQSCVSNPKKYWSLWFRGVPFEEIGRENVKEWLTWGYFNKSFWTAEDDEELEEYIMEAEKLLGRPFTPGRREARPMKPTFDAVKILHRPLLYYTFGVGGADALSHLYLLFHSFEFRSLARSFSSFPFRPLSLLAKNHSPSSHISYYYRPHTSRNGLPVLYLHGVGILHTYINFLAEFNRASDLDKPHSDGDIGFIVLEIKPISFCITNPALSKKDMCAEILSIINKHNWDKFVLMANSYGTVISSQLLKDAAVAPRIGPIVFIDPVPFLMHLPELVYNFLYRPPQSPSEHQLHYFASTDIGTAHTLARRMFWSESILWKEEVEGKKITVILSEQDIIVDAQAVGRYLTRENGVRALDDHRGDEWKGWAWKGEGLDVLWFEGLNHAELFDTEADRSILIRVLMNYCTGRVEAVPKRGTES